MKSFLIPALVIVAGIIILGAARRLDNPRDFGFEAVEVYVPWTSDGSGNATVTVKYIYGMVVGVTTDPDGDAAPTDNYDIALKNRHGATVATISDRDTANTEHLSLTTDTNPPVFVAGDLTVAISNAGAAKSGVVIVEVRQ